VPALAGADSNYLATGLDDAAPGMVYSEVEIFKWPHRSRRGKHDSRPSGVGILAVAQTFLTLANIAFSLDIEV
jgi:hypothetical protein